MDENGRGCMIEEKLKRLRAKLEENNIDGYIVPSTDEYQGEYTAPYAKRLQYITNFSGSNGIAIIFKKKAVLLTDGRYLTQAEHELDLKEFDIVDITKLYSVDWREYGIEAGQLLGYDPKLFTASQLRLFKDFKLQAVDDNLIDAIWVDQPAKPKRPAYIYPEEIAGMSFQEKLSKIQAKLQEKKAEYCLITTSDSLCWALNIRGEDVMYVPFVHGYLVVGLQKSYLFTNKTRVGQIEDFLSSHVEIMAEEDISDFLIDVK
ncbi:MAG: aminopeptidase, partial [Rickettsiaceae bacterium]|nr:aminopeptidase [Rickettsiaceae bacterium]